MNIEIRKPTDDKQAFRDIFVDGVKWGRVMQRHAGQYGVEYYFEDMAADVVREKLSKPVVHSNNGHRFWGHLRVWSDKIFLSDIGIRGRIDSAIKEAKHKGVYKPLEERLIDAIGTALAKRCLLGPQELKDIAEKERNRDDERIHIARLHQDEALRAKAQSYAELFYGANVVHCQEQANQLCEVILNAMRWAQTQ